MGLHGSARVQVYTNCSAVNLSKTALIHYNSYENELLYKFYLAQKFKPGRNDWILVVHKDLEELNINMDEEDVKKITLQKFKDIILSKIKISVKKSFVKKQGSKTENIKLDVLEPSSYILSTILKKEEIQAGY